MTENRRTWAQPAAAGLSAELLTGCGASGSARTKKPHAADRSLFIPAAAITR